MPPILTAPLDLLPVQRIAQRAAVEARIHAPPAAVKRRVKAADDVAAVSPELAVRSRVDTAGGEGGAPAASALFHPEVAVAVVDVAGVGAGELAAWKVMLAAVYLGKGWEVKCTFDRRAVDGLDRGGSSAGEEGKGQEDLDEFELHNDVSVLVSVVVMLR
jgi:hypothetical protein